MIIKKVLSGVAGALLMAGCASSERSLERSCPPAPGTVSSERSLERSSPAAEGVNPQAVKDFCDELERVTLKSGNLNMGNANAFMLLKNGKVIAEGAWDPYSLEQSREVFSMSKSFTATAVGFAIQEGLFSLDTPVISFFPDKAPAEVSEYLAAMTVQDLLTMQTGHKECTITRMPEIKEMAVNLKLRNVKNIYAPVRVTIKEDIAAGFLNTPVEYEPGTHFVYNNGATYMLSAIITKVTGISMFDYLTPRLFEPLGVAKPEWEADRNGITFGAWGLHINPETAAKFGQLYLQEGVWEGKRLLSEEWVRDASSVHSGNVIPGSVDEWQQGYGYQLWRCRTNSYRADGMLDQFIMIMPDANAVLVMFNALSWLQPTLDVLWSKLYDALLSTYTGDEDFELKKLSLDFPEDTSAEFMLKPGEKLDVVLPEGNPLAVARCSLEVRKDRITAIIDGKSNDYGFGKWLENPGSADEMTSGSPLVCRAVVEAANRVKLVTLMPDSALQSFITFTFEDNDIVQTEGFFNLGSEIPEKVKSAGKRIQE